MVRLQDLWEVVDPDNGAVVRSWAGAVRIIPAAAAAAESGRGGFTPGETAAAAAAPDAERSWSIMACCSVAAACVMISANWAGTCGHSFMSWYFGLVIHSFLMFITY